MYTLICYICIILISKLFKKHTYNLNIINKIKSLKKDILCFSKFLL